MTQPDLRRAFITQQDHSRAALQVCAVQHLPLVAAMVRRFPSGLYEPEELYQQGCIGLMKALHRYRTESGIAFSTYAVPMILGEMRMLSRQYAPIHIPRPEREKRQRIRRMSSALSTALGREPTVQELASALRMDTGDLLLLLEDITVASTDNDLDDAPLSSTISDKDDWLARVELRDLLSRLKNTDRQLMTLRYIEGLTQAKTAERLGMTQVQVSRREAVLRRQLRNEWYGTS